MGQYDKAVQYFIKSIELIEKIRKTSKGAVRRDYLASQIRTYQSLISTYMNKGEYVKAIQATEQSRARLLSEQLAGGQ